MEVVFKQPVAMRKAEFWIVRNFRIIDVQALGNGSSIHEKGFIGNIIDG